jgi:hypothetical protein
MNVGMSARLRDVDKVNQNSRFCSFVRAWSLSTSGTIKPDVTAIEKLNSRKRRKKIDPHVPFEFQ